jgi:hypothetical protein
MIARAIAIADEWNRRSWRPLLIIFVLCAAVIGFSLPSLTDRVARASFSNAPVAFDTEAAPTPWQPLWSDIETVALGGRGEGLDCSIPPIVHAAFSARAPYSKTPLPPIELLFRQACVTHDLCYRHGAATYGYSQSQCDMGLSEEAFRICRSIFSRSSDDLDWCRDQARKILGGVVFGGAQSFRGLVPPGAKPDPANPAIPAADLVSSIADYDPSPTGYVHFAIPRMVGDGCGKTSPALVVFSGRAGGMAVSARCGPDFNTVSGRDELVESGYSRRPAIPSLATDATGAGSSLLLRCRLYTDGNSTDGPFIRFDVQKALSPRPAQASQSSAPAAMQVSRSWYTACLGADKGAARSLAPQGAASLLSCGRDEGCDPLATTLYPVPGRSGRDVIAVGVSVGRCSVVAVTPSSGPRFIHLATTDEDDPNNRAGCYRWLANPPLIVDRADHLDVTLFRRGDGGSGDRDILTSVTAQLDSKGRWSDFGAPRKWMLPESAEPFAETPDANGEVALFSLHRKAAGADRGPSLVTLIPTGFLTLLGLALTAHFKARNLGGALIATAILIAALSWLLQTPTAMPGDWNQDVIIDIVRSNGLPAAHLTLAADDPILGANTPRAAQYLQSRISVIDPAKLASCKRADAPPGCGFARVAILPAYHLEVGSPPSMDILMIGIRAEPTDGERLIFARHLGDISLGAVDCSRVTALREAGQSCETFSIPGMMLVPFDGDRRNLSVVILHQSGSVGRPVKGEIKPIVVPDLLDGHWTSLK